MKPTPVGTSVGYARSSGLASSGDSSTMWTRSCLRPRLSVTSPAARTFCTQSAPGKPPTTYRLPSTVIGVTGVDRSRPDLRPGTVNTTGLSPPKLMPSRDIWMKTLFAGLSHHGGRTGLLLPIRRRYPPRRAAFWQGYVSWRPRFGLSSVCHVSAESHPHEPHLGSVSARLNWLRAGVLGANDGIVSTAGIVVGVAAATV